MKTCPHSVHSLRAVSSLLMVGVSRSVRAVAAGGTYIGEEGGRAEEREYTYNKSGIFA